MGVPAGASPDEVAAIVAALSCLLADDAARRAAVGASALPADGIGVDAWVHAARLTGRGAHLTRGPWRLAGRISRRDRA